MNLIIIVYLLIDESEDMKREMDVSKVETSGLPAPQVKKFMSHL